MEETNPERAVISPKKIILLLVIALPALILLPGIAGFPYPGNQGLYSDLSLTHYPYAVFLRNAILNHQQVPLWSSLFFSGSPFAANPLSGLWYPPGWLALLLPLPLGFNLLAFAHLIFGGWGLYRLMRSEGLGMPSALFSGMAFTSLPKLFAHYGAGHLTLLYAVPWTPWLLLACRSRAGRVNDHSLSAAISWEAPILGVIFLADPRWAVYAGLLWCVYSLFGLPQLPDFSVWKSLSLRTGWMIRQTVAALLLAAPLVIPLMEFNMLSTRSTLQSNEALIFSLPWVRLFGVLLPDFQGFHEYMVYSGQMMIVLVISALALFKSRSEVKFWLPVAVVALLISLGKNFPLLTLAAHLPLLEYLRVPSRALFIFGMCIASLSGRGVQRLLDGDDGGGKKGLNLALAAYFALLLLLMTAVWLANGKMQPNLVWGAGWALVSIIWIRLYLSGRLDRRMWQIGLFFLCLVELWSFNITLFHNRPEASVMSEGSATARRVQQLVDDQQPYRIYSPSYSISQQAAAAMGLELADGVDPLQLSAYVEYMSEASGVPAQGYSVTLPPFENGDPTVDNKESEPDSRLLGLLNVRFVVSEFPLQVEGLTAVDKIGQTWIYENQYVHPRAWVAPTPNPEDSFNFSAEDIVVEPNHVSLTATGPGLLVISEIQYPGWRVWVDGEAASIQTYLGLLRSVSLSPGEHQVVFSFCPTSLWIGLAVGLLSWSIVLTLLLKKPPSVVSNGVKK